LLEELGYFPTDIQRGLVNGRILYASKTITRKYSRVLLSLPGDNSTKDWKPMISTEIVFAKAEENVINYKIRFTTNKVSANIMSLKVI